MKLRIEVDNRTAALEIEATRERLLDDRPVMERIGAKLIALLQRNVTSRDFLPDTAETLEKKRRAGAGARPLTWSGKAAANLRVRSKAHFARAFRGEEWYMFLHDLGAGRQLERKWVFATAADEADIVATYEKFVFQGDAA